MQININDDIFIKGSDVELIPIALSEDFTRINVKLNDISSGQALPTYEGPYEVEPRKEQQTLNTKEKAMKDNVVVNKIAYTETQNESGGMTAIIGFD